MAILMTTLKVVGASILALASSGVTYEYIAERMNAISRQSAEWSI